MDCEKLNQDIAELQTLRDRFAQKIDELNDTMRGKIEVRKVQEEVQGLEDQIMGSYLTEFKENNPELFGWHLGEKINGFKGIAWSIAQLPEGEGVLVGGNVGTLYVCRKDKDGKWKLGEKINGFQDIDGNNIDITSIAQLPDGGMLIGSNRGMLYECREYEDEKWALVDSIGEFVDTSGEYLDIRSIVPLPDGGILVGGRGGLYECRYEVEYGEWCFNNIINGSEDKGGYSLEITSIAQLPDGEGVLVGGDAGTLYVCRRDKNKKWKLGEKINGFEDKGGYIPSVTSVAQLPDGEMLIGNYWGVLYEVNHSSPSVNTIKQNLDRIIQKGAV